VRGAEYVLVVGGVGAAVGRVAAAGQSVVCGSLLLSEVVIVIGAVHGVNDTSSAQVTVLVMVWVADVRDERLTVDGCGCGGTCDSASTVEGRVVHTDVACRPPSSTGLYTGVSIRPMPVSGVG